MKLDTTHRAPKALNAVAVWLVLLLLSLGLIPDAQAAEDTCTFLVGDATVESEVNPGPPPIIVVHLDENSDGAGLKIEHVVNTLTTAVTFTAESGAVFTVVVSNDTGQPIGGLSFEEHLRPWLEEEGYVPHVQLLVVFYTGISCGSQILPVPVNAAFKAFFS